jgi:hypothetical protein
MRKIRDVLRLSAADISKRKIAASLAVSATAAGECIRRAWRARLTWPLPEGLTDQTLERRLYQPPTVAAKDRRPQPNWATVHRELRRPSELPWPTDGSVPFIASEKSYWLQLLVRSLRVVRGNRGNSGTLLLPHASRIS